MNFFIFKRYFFNFIIQIFLQLDHRVIEWFGLIIILKCVKKQNELSALLFPPEGKQESRDQFYSLIFLSTSLCIFLIRSASLKNNTVANQAKIFLLASAPRHTDLSCCVSAAQAENPLKSSRSAGQVWCISLSYLSSMGSTVTFWESVVPLLGGSVSPADSWPAPACTVIERKKERQPCLFLVLFLSFLKQVMLAS